MAPLRGRNRRQWRVVVLSFFGATTFWLLNALNKDYKTVFSYPVQFNYNNSKFIPVEALPSTIDVRVAGTGWELIRETISDKSTPLIVEPARLPRSSQISANRLENIFSKTHHHIKLDRVVTESINYDIDYKISKLVALYIPAESIKTGENFVAIPPVRITPDTVFIEGPARLMKRIGNRLLLSLDQNGLDEDFDDDITLNDYLKGITSETEEVNVAITISPLVVGEKSIPITIVNHTDTTIQLANKTARLKIKYPGLLASQLTDSLFRIEVNMENITKGADTTLPLTITLLPEAVKEAELLDKRVAVKKK